jgi:hypothetical protein
MRIYQTHGRFADGQGAQTCHGMGVVTGTHSRVSGMARPVMVQRVGDISQTDIRPGAVHPLGQDPGQCRDAIR